MTTASITADVTRSPITLSGRDVLPVDFGGTEYIYSGGSLIDFGGTILRATLNAGAT